MLGGCAIAFFAFRYARKFEMHIPNVKFKTTTPAFPRLGDCLRVASCGTGVIFTLSPVGERLCYWKLA